MKKKDAAKSFVDSEQKTASPDSIAQKGKSNSQAIANMSGSKQPPATGNSNSDQLDEFGEAIAMGNSDQEEKGLGIGATKNEIIAKLKEKANNLSFPLVMNKKKEIKGHELGCNSNMRFTLTPEPSLSGSFSAFIGKDGNKIEIPINFDEASAAVNLSWKNISLSVGGDTKNGTWVSGSIDILQLVLGSIGTALEEATNGGLRMDASGMIGMKFIFPYEGNPYLQNINSSIKLALHGDLEKLLKMDSTKLKEKFSKGIDYSRRAEKGLNQFNDSGSNLSDFNNDKKIDLDGNDLGIDGASGSLQYTPDELKHEFGIGAEFSIGTVNQAPEKDSSNIENWQEVTNEAAAFVYIHVGPFSGRLEWKGDGEAIGTEDERRALVKKGIDTALLSAYQNLPEGEDRVGLAKKVNSTFSRQFSQFISASEKQMVESAPKAINNSLKSNVHEFGLAMDALSIYEISGRNPVLRISVEKGMRDIIESRFSKQHQLILHGVDQLFPDFNGHFLSDGGPCKSQNGVDVQVKRQGASNVIFDWERIERNILGYVHSGANKSIMGSFSGKIEEDGLSGTYREHSYGTDSGYDLKTLSNDAEHESKGSASFSINEYGAKGQFSDEKTNKTGAWRLIRQL